jgi:ssDNA thymidine ADP-ribosyltransferase, DarT
MAPSDRAGARGITEVLHYTSEKGIYGALVKDAVLSRRRLEDDPEIEFIFQAVWPVKAPAWKDHISLSLTRINLDLFERSRSHYPEYWWGVVSFNTEILDHEDVHFTTTNNIYPTCERGQGEEGLENMFQPSVLGRYSHEWTRDGLTDDQTTDRTAEVLYPGSLSLAHLNRIFVPTLDERRLIRAWCDALGKEEPPIDVRPDVFT